MGIFDKINDKDLTNMLEKGLPNTQEGEEKSPSIDLSFLEDLEDEENKDKAITLFEELENSTKIGSQIIDEFLKSQKDEYQEAVKGIVVENRRSLELFAQSELALKIIDYFIGISNLNSLEIKCKDIINKGDLFKVDYEKYEKESSKITEEEKKSISYLVYKLDYFISELI